MVGSKGDRSGVIGEVWDTDPIITSFFVGGTKRYDGVDSLLTTVFDFPLYRALRDVILRGQPVQRIIDVLQRDWLYRDPEGLVTFIGNHDTSRFMSERGASKERLKTALALLLTLRGTPQIYYGDEIGMLGGDDPDNRRDFPGGFPGDIRNGFRATGRGPAEQEIFSHVQQLLALRRDHPALRGGRQWHIGWDDSYYAFLREDRQDQLLVIFNNADAPRTLAVPLGDTRLATARGFIPLLGAPTAKLQAGYVEVTMAPVSVAVYQVK